MKPYVARSNLIEPTVLGCRRKGTTLIQSTHSVALLVLTPTPLRGKGAIKGKGAIIGQIDIKY
jgi:hypothetical protein